MLALDILRESSEATPDDEDLCRAARLALEFGGADAKKHWELCLRIVERDEMQALNQRYRGKNRPTNVLSFPADLPPEVTLDLLGDIVVCAPVVRDEAAAQGKTLAAHWDHMLIHGVLHLLGYDHETDTEATEMESLESKALARLGWPCPYQAMPAAVAGGING
jgi:probable rRNA maturation factor